MLRPEHVLTLCPISTLFRACMSLVNLHVLYIVSHHLFTVIYKVLISVPSSSYVTHHLV
jgi:hypothetical protein